MMEMMDHMEIQLSKSESPKMSYATVSATPAPRGKEKGVVQYGFIIFTNDNHMEHEELENKITEMGECNYPGNRY